MEKSHYKPTKWESDLKNAGFHIITWDHKAIMDYLLAVFERDKDELLLKAAMDNTKRHQLEFFLDFEQSLGCNVSGSVIYNKKKRQFSYIEYSDRYNWMVQFSITSRCAFFAREHYTQWKLIFPFGASIKVMKEFLLNN